MNVVIATVPHKAQRYDTVGDWYYDTDGVLHIKVSKLSERKREALIAVHELIEAMTCEVDGVTQKAVDDFDKAYNQNPLTDDTPEPGDSPDAPYKKQHCLATGIERILAQQWGVDWSDYDREVNEL